MKKFVKPLISVGLLIGLAFSLPAKAAIVLGGINFADNAFADQVVSFTPGISFQRQTTNPGTRVATTPEDAVLGSDLASSTIEMVGGQSLTLAFTDNVVVNGPGADLAIFELFAGVEYGNLTINGVTLAISGASLGFIPIPGTAFSNNVSLAQIDLSAFGVAPGGSVSSLTITGNGSEYAAFGAINSAAAAVPVPGTLALFGIALGAFGFLRRRRQ